MYMKLSFILYYMNMIDKQMIESLKPDKSKDFIVKYFPKWPSIF